MIFEISFLEAKHCPASSDVRALIAKPPPTCQSQTIVKLFDDNFVVEASRCTCCFSCIKQHGSDGCDRCVEFLNKYFPQNTKPKVTKSVAVELKQAIEELFAAMGQDMILIEGELGVTASSFAKDFVKLIDEVRDENDIMEIWHIESSLAQELFLLFKEVVYGDSCESNNDRNDNIESEFESDELDESFDFDTNTE